MHNRLATGDIILQWNPQANAQCILCHSATETHEHLFFSCSFSEEIWKRLMQKLMGQSFSYLWTQVLDLLTTSSASGTVKFLMRYAFQVSVHTIWLERNGRRHGKPHRPTSILIKFIDKQIRNRIISLQGRGGRTISQALADCFEARE